MRRPLSAKNVVWGAMDTVVPAMVLLKVSSSMNSAFDKLEADVRKAERHRGIFFWRRNKK